MRVQHHKLQLLVLIALPECEFIEHGGREEGETTKREVNGTMQRFN